MSICPAEKPMQGNSIKEVYAVKSIDKDVLLQSSSGGLFTMLSDWILLNGGVVYGAAHDAELFTRHTRAVNKNERAAQCGSKYVQSDLNDSYMQAINDLRAGRFVLFTGTPCQIVGLKACIPNNVNDEKLFLVDIICNGAPSPRLFGDYLKYCEKMQKRKIVEHYHRPKDTGWGHIEKNAFEDGSYDNESDFAQAWKRIFYSGKPLRECCYACPFANDERFSDITIGDYWGVQNTGIEIDCLNGVSLCLINTGKGKKLFEQLSDVKSVQSNIADAKVKQPRLRGVCANGDGHKEFWEAYDKRGPDYIIRKYGRCSNYVRFKHWVKKQIVHCSTNK